MKPITEQEAKTVSALLDRCTEVKAEGFRVDLSREPQEWARLVRALGSKRLCAAVAQRLSELYAARFSEPFLFSVRCMTFEFRYHLNAYLCMLGLRRMRHVTTLLFAKTVLEQKCRSVEIDTGDVYRRSQRLAFRYFFGIAPRYRRTARDPYAKKVNGRYVRVPLYRF